MREPALALTSSIATLFEELGIRATSDDSSVLSFWIESEIGQWLARALIREEQDQLIVYSMCPVKVQDEHQIAIVELLNEINFGLPVGNFELDASDGETRFRTGVLRASSLDGEGLDSLIGTHRAVMARYLPVIAAEGESR